MDELMSKINAPDCSRFAATVRSRMERWDCCPGAAVLVAFSGGADSTALLAALTEVGYRAVALHCNFHLRGEESDRDERFCRGMCHALGVELKVIHFDVHARVEATGESVEMAARELRYRWFDQQHEATGLPLVTAHHASDNVETFFLNLLRGSGLRGLSGIPPRRGYILRPILDMPKEEILAYLSECGAGYVTDSTNLEDDYRRNRLRLHVLPALEREMPGAMAAVVRTVDNLRRDRALLDAFADELKARHLREDGSVSLAALHGDPLGCEKLYHILGGALSFSTVCRVMDAVEVSGKVFEGSGGKRFLLDRGALVPMHQCTDAGRPQIEAEVLPAGSFAPSRDAMEVWFDGAVLTGGATWELRRWRHGDRIAPFGMRGTKAVSDLLTDAKIAVNRKNDIWVLACDGEPVWVVGLRTSRRYCVTPRSEAVVRLRVKKDTYKLPECIKCGG